MKYKDILQFDPITEVIQLDLLSKDDYRKEIVRTFVYPEYFIETILPQMIKNMEFGGRDQKGIQVSQAEIERLTIGCTGPYPGAGESGGMSVHAVRFHGGCRGV